MNQGNYNKNSLVSYLGRANLIALSLADAPMQAIPDQIREDMYHMFLDDSDYSVKFRDHCICWFVQDFGLDGTPNLNDVDVVKKVFHLDTLKIHVSIYKSIHLSCYQYTYSVFRPWSSIKSSCRFFSMALGLDPQILIRISSLEYICRTFPSLWYGIVIYDWSLKLSCSRVQGNSIQHILPTSSCIHLHTELHAAGCVHVYWQCTAIFPTYYDNEYVHNAVRLIGWPTCIVRFPLSGESAV